MQFGANGHAGMQMLPCMVVHITRELLCICVGTYLEWDYGAQPIQPLNFFVIG